MLGATIEAGETASVSALARKLGIPVATAHRQVTTLVAQGYLLPSGAGHIAGPRLLGLVHRIDEKQILARVSAPILQRLAERLGSVAQLGTFENDMVTYRIKAGQGAGDLFTKVGMQLEAYCSGIGKVLLAHLPADERQAYLAGGPFVPLTSRTIVEPDLLARELENVAARGYAVDDGEVAEGLICMAVPIHARRGHTPAAISISRLDTEVAESDRTELLNVLRQAASEIEKAAFHV